MRRLSLLMTVCFLLIILMGCGKKTAIGSPDTSTELTTEEATEESTEAPAGNSTESPTVAPAESAPPLSELSAELKAEIEAAWQKQFEKELKWSESINDYEFDTVRYYGTHQGLPVLFQSKSVNIASAGKITVADIEMEWGSPFQIYVYKEGVFIPLYLAHSRGYLSDDDVKHIAEIHEYFVIFRGSGKTPDIGSPDTSAEVTTEEATEESTEAPTVASAESAPPLSELSAELKAEIEAAWQKQFEKALVWSEIIDDYVDGTVRYYGTHQDFPVFFQCIPTATQNSGRITIGDVKMEWGYNFQIYVYKDGVFYTHLQALQEQLLTFDDFKYIAAIHDYFVIAKYGER